jgi:hypothetical protein
MALNIVEEIQKKLGIPGLQKIDPNTQEVKKPENITAQNFLWQAAIPAVLLGLYKFTGDKDGNAAIINGSLNSDLLAAIFGGNSQSAITQVAQYTGNTMDYASEKMELVAHQAISVIKENISGEKSDTAVRQFLIDQRNNILLYLPPELQIGTALGDNTSDDRTNKMEGPVSSYMHWIEKFFPSTDRKKEENW